MTALHNNGARSSIEESKDGCEVSFLVVLLLLTILPQCNLRPSFHRTRKTLRVTQQDNGSTGWRTTIFLPSTK